MTSIPDPFFSSDNTRIYTSYDTQEPPPHPGDAWTRFVCISDTHSRTNYEVPYGDVLLHSGDLSSWGHLPQLKKTVKWTKTLPHPVKVLIAGNHDLCLDDDWSEDGPFSAAGECIPNANIIAAQELMRCDATRDAGIHYLEYESLRITLGGRSWEVYGSPLEQAAPRYALGAFQYVGAQDGDAIYAEIPPSTEILLTHTPGWGICDVSKRGNHAGCRSLKNRLESPELSKCRLHVFGHIHEAQGAAVHPVSADGELSQMVRVSVNAALHDYPATIVDLLN
ncbi:hypothetical protein EUX98_g5104 [Antrodiella citrinella]|uniref:Calcineurin-like phosphoesterase domain-containing protein n=1 Tax=Antrodiella citrinella TaxID=2447956 RepID=A0A4S4MSD6_9APHY|nr:hypothetical protein EUX98_g5104 [Antrodiella citrinella]